MFRIFFTFFVSDKKAALAGLIREPDAHPPAVMVPAHGDLVSRPDLGPVLVGMLRAAG